MAEFNLKDYTEHLQEDLSSFGSLYRDYDDFVDNLAFEHHFEGAPAKNVLFDAFQIRKKTFDDNATEQGIWLGIDSDGLAKINIGDPSTGHFTFEGGIFTVTDTYLIFDNSSTNQYMVMASDFIRMFDTSKDQNLELSAGTGSDRGVIIFGSSGDNYGYIYSSVDGYGDEFLSIFANDYIYITNVLYCSSAVFTSGTTASQYATAIPAGGVQGYALSSTQTFGIYFGSGAPTVSAAQGSLYLRSDGSSTSTRMYVNTDNSTGWSAVTTAS